MQHVGVDGMALPLSWTNPEIRTRGKKKKTVPDSGRRTPVLSSCTSCSTQEPHRLAREGRPHCCCMRRPGAQDTNDRKGRNDQNEQGEGKADVPPRPGSMWLKFTCHVWC